LSAITGAVLWRSPSDDYSSPTLVGDLAVSINNLGDPGKAKMLRYRDAATATDIDAKNASGAAAIERAVRFPNRNPVLIGKSSALWLLNIAAGTATILHNVTGYLLCYEAFPDQGRVVLYTNAGDDVPGQSTFPRYVECVDLTGAMHWSFPKDLKFISADKMSTIPDLYSILPVTSCRTCGTVLCVNAKVDRNGKFRWYGLDVRDGKVLWKSAVVDEPPVTAECGAGFLVIAYRNTARGKVNLEWMDGRTGKMVRIAPAPNAAMMVVAGSDLLVVDPNGNLSACSLETILPAAARKGIQSMNRNSSN
jgi:hypothetical protein